MKLDISKYTKTPVLDIDKLEKSIGYEIFNDNLSLRLFKDKNENILTPLNKRNYYYKIDNNRVYIMYAGELVQNFKKHAYKQIHGTYTSIIKSAILGLLNPFKITLLIFGSGYRVSFNDELKCFSFQFGSSYVKSSLIYNDVNISIENNGTVIHLSSHHKEHIGTEAARIFKLKPVNVYKGFGIRYKHIEFKPKIIKKKN